MGGPYLPVIDNEPLPLLRLPQYPSASEVTLTAFPSINPLVAARLISLGCSLSELLGLNEDEQRQLAEKLSDVPTNSLELFFQQAMYGQPVTGHAQPLALEPNSFQPDAQYGYAHTKGNTDQRHCMNDGFPSDEQRVQPDLCCTDNSVLHEPGYSRAHQNLQKPYPYAASHMPHADLPQQQHHRQAVSDHQATGAVDLEQSAVLNPRTGTTRWQQNRHQAPSDYMPNSPPAGPAKHSAQQAIRPEHKPHSSANPFTNFSYQPQQGPGNSPEHSMEAHTVQQQPSWLPHKQQQWELPQQLPQQPQQQQQWQLPQHAWHQSQQQQQWQAQQSALKPDHFAQRGHAGNPTAMPEPHTYNHDLMEVEEVCDDVGDQYAGAWDAEIQTDHCKSALQRQQQQEQRQQKAQRFNMHQQVQQPTDWQQFLPAAEDEVMEGQEPYVDNAGENKLTLERQQTDLKRPCAALLLSAFSMTPVCAVTVSIVSSGEAITVDIGQC